MKHVERNGLVLDGTSVMNVVGQQSEPRRAPQWAGRPLVGRALRKLPCRLCSASEWHASRSGSRQSASRTQRQAQSVGQLCSKQQSRDGQQDVKVPVTGRRMQFFHVSHLCPRGCSILSRPFQPCCSESAGRSQGASEGAIATTPKNASEKGTRR